MVSRGCKLVQVTFCFTHPLHSRDNAMNYLGIDLHKHESYIVLINDNGKVEQRRTV